MGPSVPVYNQLVKMRKVNLISYCYEAGNVYLRAYCEELHCSIQTDIT